MLEYILQNGCIMKLQIIINKKQSVEKIATYYEDENELQLIFKNTKEYLAFLKHRELTKDDFDSIFNSEDEIKIGTCCFISVFAISFSFLYIYHIIFIVHNNVFSAMLSGHPIQDMQSFH